MNDLLVNNHPNVSHQLHSLLQFVEFQERYRPMYNHLPAVVKVEEHQGPDSVIQTKTEEMLKCAVPENIQYSHPGRSLEILTQKMYPVFWRSAATHVIMGKSMEGRFHQHSFLLLAPLKFSSERFKISSAPLKRLSDRPGNFLHGGG